MTKLHEAYYAARRADDEYQAELERVYKSQAGDARYDSRRNAATPRLRTLRDIWRDAESKRSEMAAVNGTCANCHDPEVDEVEAVECDYCRAIF